MEEKVLRLPLLYMKCDNSTTQKRGENCKTQMVCAVNPEARQAFLLITNEEQKIGKYSLLVHPNENQARTPIISGGKFKGGSRIKTLSVTKPLTPGPSGSAQDFTFKLTYCLPSYTFPSAKCFLFLKIQLRHNFWQRKLLLL